MSQNMVMGIKDLLETRREEILRLARIHGAEDVRVFGSVARGEATASSDVDFLVEAGPKTTAFFPGGFLADLESLLGCPVQVVTKAALHPMLRDRILREAVRL